MTLLNTKEAAERLGISTVRVRQLIREGKIEAQNMGRDYAIEEGALAQVTVYGRAGRPTQFDIFGPDYLAVASVPGWNVLTEEKKAAKLLAEVKKRDAERAIQRPLLEGREIEYMSRVIRALEANPARKVGAKKTSTKKASKRGAAK